MFLRLMILGCLFSSGAFANRVYLTEGSLDEFIKKGTSSVEQLEVKKLESEERLQSYMDRFSLNIVGKSSYADSEEKSLASFIPTFGPTRKFSIGLEKETEYGAKLGLNAFANQDSTVTKSIDGVSTTGLGLTLEVDLWKNLFGKLSKYQKSGLEVNRNRSELQLKIDRKVYLINMRKAYWSLVSIEESLKVSKKIYQTSLKQLATIKRKRKQSVADKGDVARANAQVVSRKSQIDVLEYQKADLIRFFKSELEDLEGKDIFLGKYNINKTIQSVLACTSFISKQVTIPWKYTYYDELVELLKGQYESEDNLSSSHDDIDVSLTSMIQSSGVGKGTSRSFDDWGDEKKIGYSVGVNIKIPIGESKKKTSYLKRSIAQKKYHSSKRYLLNNLNAEHTQILKKILSLEQAAKGQRLNEEMLEESLKHSNRKYSQARISLVDLINEQNLFFGSQISSIEARLSVIHALFDYFKYFTEMPCAINGKL